MEISSRQCCQSHQLREIGHSGPDRAQSRARHSWRICDFQCVDAIARVDFSDGISERPTRSNNVHTLVVQHAADHNVVEADGLLFRGKHRSKLRLGKSDHVCLFDVVRTNK